MDAPQNDPPAAPEPPPRPPLYAVRPQEPHQQVQQQQQQPIPTLEHVHRRRLAQIRTIRTSSPCKIRFEMRSLLVAPSWTAFEMMDAARDNTAPMAQCCYDFALAPGQQQLPQPLSEDERAVVARTVDFLQAVGERMGTVILENYTSADDPSQLLSRILASAARNPSLEEIVLTQCTLSFDAFSLLFRNDLGLKTYRINGLHITGVESQGYTEQDLTRIVAENTTLTNLQLLHSSHAAAIINGLAAKVTELRISRPVKNNEFPALIASIGNLMTRVKHFGQPRRFLLLLKNFEFTEAASFAPIATAISNNDDDNNNNVHRLAFGLFLFGVTRFDSSSADILKTLPVDFLALTELQFDDDYDTTAFFRSILRRREPDLDLLSLGSAHNHIGSIFSLLHQISTLRTLHLQLSECNYNALLDHTHLLNGVHKLTISFVDIPTAESRDFIVDSLKANTEIEHIAFGGPGANSFSADQLRQIEQLGQRNALHHSLVLRNDPHWPDEVAGIQGRFDDAFTALYLATRALASSQFDHFAKPTPRRRGSS